MRISNHLNIVKLLEVINTEETLLIVMEYLSGGDFFSHLRLGQILRTEAYSA